MDLSNDEVAIDLTPFLRVYKDGRVERFVGTEIVPPSVDPHTGVSSKDVVIVPETGLSARIYIPRINDAHRKLPLLVYFHGGGFCIETAFSPTYHSYLTSLVAEANVVAVSVDYRRSPEHPLPIAYDDSWAALQWVASHLKGEGLEPWLKDHADLGRVFLAGDSAGANIAHNMAIRAGVTEWDGVKLLGISLIHPYFLGEPVASEATDMEMKAIADKMWLMACPSTSGFDDPLINPAASLNLSRLGCTQVLVFVAEKDLLRDRGRIYHEALGQSGWKGGLEIMEAKGMNHIFHLMNPTCEEAVTMMTRLASFLNQDELHSI